MNSTREGYVFDTECNFCAREAQSFVSQVNSKICPDCYTWASNVMGLENLGLSVVQRAQ